MVIGAGSSESLRNRSDQRGYMSVETFVPNTESSALNMTADAIAHFKQQLAQRPEDAVRLCVKTSGCSGYMYEIDFVTAGEGTDARYEFDGIVLYVAEDALPVLRGTEIDYVVEGVNASIQFKNPNAKAMCGCGESFTL